MANLPNQSVITPALAAIIYPDQPVAPKPGASKAEHVKFRKNYMAWEAACEALTPKRTKMPVISNLVKRLFFTMNDGKATSEAVLAAAAAAMPSHEMKLSTVKTFRGDAVNTLTVMSELPGAWLGKDALAWLAANRK